MSFRLTASLISRCIKTNKFNPQVIAKRGTSDYVKHYRLSMYQRRRDQGPEIERPQSDWLWNRDAELFSFGKRLGEEFNEKTLNTAFVNKSYHEKEMENIKQHELNSTEFKMEDNEELANSGSNLIEEVLKKFLRSNVKHLPEDGVQAVVDYLSSDSMLFYISSNLGVKDLVLAREFPPSEETMSKTFRAVVGALYKDQGYEIAEKFIRDFIGVQLVGKRLDDIWEIKDPMNRLFDELVVRGEGEPESRLLWSSASETILANYIVGIYSNKKLIGQSPGESISVAEELAARDALRTLYQIQDNRKPFQF